MQHSLTTPFGRRSLTHGQIMGQRATYDVAPDAVVHKWHVFNDIREAKVSLGLTDRALAILNALLTFHPDTTLGAEDELIVFPSNNQLMARAYGMSPATLRRHLSNLVECGIVIRRDSPNGKRYARKTVDGEIDQAFGFDLKPLVARASEFAARAEEVRAERRALKRAKEECTLLRRDVVKLIEFGHAEAVPGTWFDFETRYRMIVLTLPRLPDVAMIAAVNAELAALRAEIEKILIPYLDSQNSSANESQFECHIQNSNPNFPKESEAVYRHEQKVDPIAKDSPLPAARVVTREHLPLRLVLDACPNIGWLGKGGDIRTWADLTAAVDVVRPMLGISPGAWGEAIAVLGPDHATATLAAIYQRADLIHSAGGYLRNLVTRAKNGQFTVWPMLMALLRAKLEADQSAAKPTGSASG